MNKGIIERSENEDLYKKAASINQDVKAHLDVFGMELIIKDDIGIIGSRNKPDDVLDEQSEKLGCAPILPSFGHSTLTYFESRAVVFAIARRQQEEREGQGPIWISDKEYTEFLSKAYRTTAQEDQAVCIKRAQAILSRLEKENILECSSSNPSDKYWRGTDKMDIMIQRGDIDAFHKSLEGLLNISINKEPHKTSSIEP
jgi:hypothetical protein